MLELNSRIASLHLSPLTLSLGPHIVQPGLVQSGVELSRIKMSYLPAQT